MVQSPFERRRRRRRRPSISTKRLRSPVRLQQQRHEPRGVSGDRDICACAIWANCYCFKGKEGVERRRRRRGLEPQVRHHVGCLARPRLSAVYSHLGPTTFQPTNQPKSLRLFRRTSERAIVALKGDKSEETETNRPKSASFSKAKLTQLSPVDLRCVKQQSKERIGPRTGNPRRDGVGVNLRRHFHHH